MRCFLLAMTFLLLQESRPAAANPADSLDCPRFESRLDSLRQAIHIPGLAMAIVRDTTILSVRGFGLADVEAGRPVTADTPFNIASVTKPLSAVLALRLVELGQLDLDRQLMTYAEFPELCRDARAEGGLFFADFECDQHPMTLRNVLSMTVNGTPGTRFFYNPVIYSWASRPIMEVTGQPFSTLMTQYILEPAGMTRSARINRQLPLREDLAQDLALSYHLDDSSRVVRSPPLRPQGDGAAGGVISTARDLARFDIALTQGKLVSVSSRSAMWKAGQSPDGATLPYGLGWFVETINGEPVVWHTGLWEGACSALYLRLPNRGLSLILLANSDGLRWDNALDEADLARSPFARLFVEELAR